MPNNPASKISLTAHWSELVLLNFDIDPKHLQPYLPQGTEVDLYNEKAYLSVVAMTCSEISKFGLVLPINPFNEIIVRFYVRRRFEDRFHTGTCVIKKYRSGRVGNLLMGRFMGNPASLMKIRNENTGFNEADSAVKPEANYRWKRDNKEYCIRVAARSQTRKQNRESKEQFIMDHHYRFFEKRGVTYETHISHPQWLLWDAASGNFECDRPEFFGPDIAKRLHKRPASVFLARGSKVVVHKSEKINLK
ncbi:DUF2071 domain-containing protein, partial [Vicingaceae bacterium]|nr:DUF2071 domain-containing protein [Vicingaceae bacterium]